MTPAQVDAFMDKIRAAWPGRWTDDMLLIWRERVQRWDQAIAVEVLDGLIDSEARRPAIAKFREAYQAVAHDEPPDRRRTWYLGVADWTDDTAHGIAARSPLKREVEQLRPWIAEMNSRREVPIIRTYRVDVEVAPDGTAIAGTDRMVEVTVEDAPMPIEVAKDWIAEMRGGLREMAGAQHAALNDSAGKRPIPYDRIITAAKLTAAGVEDWQARIAAGEWELVRAEYLRKGGAPAGRRALARAAAAQRHEEDDPDVF